MIKKIFLLKNLEYSNHRKIAESFVKKLKDRILHFKFDKVFFENDYEFSSFENNIDIASNTYNSLLYVTYDIETIDEYSLSNPIYREFNKPILVDHSIDFIVHPNYLKSNYTITLKLKDKSKDKLIRIAEKIKLLYSIDVTEFEESIEYFYPIPEDLLKIIKNIYRLKYNKDDSYYDYLKSIAKVPIDFINKRGRDISIPIIKEKQAVNIDLKSDIYSKYDITFDRTYWNLELEFGFEYDAVNSLTAQIPIIINNKLISPKVISKNITKILSSNNSFVDAYYEIINQEHYLYNPENFILIRNPVYDMFDISAPLKPGYMRIFSTIVLINDDGVLLNLKELEDFFPNSLFLRLLYEKPDDTLFRLYENFIFIELFENSNLLFDKLYIDEDLNIRFKNYKPDKVKTYRLVFNLLYELDYLLNKFNNEDLEALKGLFRELNINPTFLNKDECEIYFNFFLKELPIN